MKGLRFQKRIKVAPGLRVNLSKSGISSSIGGPGATVNVGKRGVTGTVGAPGTGVSYSKQLKKGDAAPGHSGVARVLIGLVLVMICGAAWLAL